LKSYNMSYYQSSIVTTSGASEPQRSSEVGSSSVKTGSNVAGLLWSSSSDHEDGQPGPRYSIHYRCEDEELRVTSTAANGLVTRRDLRVNHRRKTACHRLGRVFPDGASVLRGPRYQCFKDQDTGREQVRGHRRLDGRVTDDRKSVHRDAPPDAASGNLNIKHWLRTVKDHMTSANAENSVVTVGGTTVKVPPTVFPLRCRRASPMDPLH
jgi:hypothetical protein